MEEFISSLDALNIRMGRNDAMAIFAVIDVDGSGKLSKDEFVEYYVANFT